jgi:protease-4
MLKFLIGLLAGVILAFLIILIIAVSAFRMQQSPPEIAEGSALVLKLNGDIPERAPVELPFISTQTKPTMANVWMMLKMAAADSRIKAVILEPRGVDAGWAKIEEIHAGLEAFRKSGKPLWAFLISPGSKEYYLATAADRVFMGPADVLYLKGMRADMMYFKGTLDKLGVEVQVEHAGKYKDFGDMFTRSSMSPATQEVVNSVLDELYGRLVARVANGRKKTAEDVLALIDRGPFLADQALKAGLVDELRYEDQLFGELKTKLGGGDVKRVTTDAYLHTPPSSLGLEGKTRVAYVVAQGSITQSSPVDPLSGEGGITAEGFNKILRQVSGDNTIRAVLVRIDSPGGEVVASDEIWREMNLLSKKKPMVISMSDTAASGGYYMAMTGDPIVAYPGTYTGSIGVVFGKPTLKGLYSKLGITKDGAQRGRFADIDSDYDPLDTAELAKLQEGIDNSYRDFVSKVAAARHKS